MPTGTTKPPLLAQSCQASQEGTHTQDRHDYLESFPSLGTHRLLAGGSTRVVLRDAADLTGCDRAVQQQREAEKPPLLKKKHRQGKGLKRLNCPSPALPFLVMKVPNFHLLEVHHVSRETDLSTPVLQYFLHRMIVLRAK